MLHTSLMTFAHIADLQLGCNRFDGRLSRRREQDFYDSWYLLAKQLADREDIDYVVIVGDIFEYATPSTAARFAFERGLNFLARAFKKVILVSGNHESPRSVETMHPLALYWDRPGVTAVTDEATTVDDFRVIPWQWGQPITDEDLDSNAPVLVVHAACPVLDVYRDGARDFLPEMGKGYQYVALGDYHVPTQIAPNAWYSGSIEHTSFGEADATCGGWIVTLDENGTDYTQEWIEAKTRPMANIHIRADYEEEVVGMTTLASKDPERMYRVIIHGIEPTQIDPLMLSDLKNTAHFVKIVFQDRPEPPALVDFGPQTILDQWETFVEHAEYGPEVAAVGVEILEEAMANG